MAVIREWAEALRPEGFERHGQFLRRLRGPFRHSVWETPSKFDKRKRLITVGVELEDPFLSRPEPRLILDGRVGPDGVVLVESGLAGHQWTEGEDTPAALDAMRRHGLPWLDAFSEPAALIAHYEGVLRDGMAPAPAPGGRTARLAERLLVRQAGPPTPATRRPPVYHYYASLVYHLVGDRESACRHAAAWLEVARILGGEEPQRTERQLERMGCPKPGA